MHSWKNTIEKSAWNLLLKLRSHSAKDKIAISKDTWSSSKFYYTFRK